jgi:alpha-tubulin suppressor-like RCC1 family protein
MAWAGGRAEAQRVAGAEEEARRLVVMVTCAAGGSERFGAGIIVGAASGHLSIATADHIVRPCRSASVAAGTGLRVSLRDSPNRALTAVAAEADSALDLAMLRIAGAGVGAGQPLPLDRLGDPDSVEEKKVIVLAHPRRKGWSRDSAPRVTYLEKEWIRYDGDSLAEGYAGGVLLTDDFLVTGMTVRDQPDPESPRDGLALRIDVLLERVRRWGHPVGLARPTTPATFASITVGYSHMCALTPGGAAYCWGENEKGQLGNGVAPSTRLRRVLGGVTFRALDAANDYTCGIVAEGAAYCWGDNASGVVGAEPDSSSVPTRVSGALRFMSLSAGGRHACGLVEGGAIYCWGENRLGQLGDGSTRKSTTPVRVTGGQRFTSVSAGGSHTCGLDTDGAAHCWGDDSTGALGDGTYNQSPRPVAVAGGLRFVSVHASAAGHTCGVTRSGAMYCWGQNADYQLGSGASSGTFPTPVAVAGGLAFKSIGSGSSSTCGLTSAGATYCWGTNSHGQLGDGTEEHRGVPAPVAGGLRFGSVEPAFSTSDTDFTCGLTTGGAALCWGEPEEESQGGTGFPEGGATVPTPVRP